MVDEKEKCAAADKLSNAVYEAAVSVFEELEHAGKIKGNGHHHAQRMANLSEQMIDDLWIDN